MASIVSAGTTSATALNMSADTSGVLQLASNNGTVALTVSTAQNIGVGTTSPSAKLHLYNAGSVDCNVRVQAQTGTDKYFDLGTGGSGHYLYGYGAYDMYFGTNNNTRMTITSAGNIGMGVSSTSYKLEVNGSVKTGNIVGNQSFTSNQNFPTTFYPLNTYGSVSVPNNNTWTSVFAITDAGTTTGTNYGASEDSVSGFVNVYKDFGSAYFVALLAFSTKNVFGFNTLTIVSSYTYNCAIQITSGNTLQVRQSGSNSYPCYFSIFAMH